MRWTSQKREDKAIAKQARKRLLMDWHSHYAWLPVNDSNTGDWFWFEWVLRKRSHNCTSPDVEYNWHYKEMNW